MTYSEAILRLEKDPTLVFKLVEGGKTWTLKTDYDPRFPDDSVYFILECDSKDYHDRAVEFSGNLLIDDDGWVGAIQPVTWQEAIQARADDKRVWCEFHNQSWSVAELVVNHLYLKKALDVGKWYVEG